MPKLSQAEKAVQERMLAMLEYASRSAKSATRWHDIGFNTESKEAAKLLETRGVIEVSWVRNQYRLTPEPTQ